VVLSGYTSSTTKTGHHDIAEILLKVALKHQKYQNQITQFLHVWCIIFFELIVTRASCSILVDFLYQLWLIVVKLMK
jgi:hypothetical protein